MGVSPFSVIEYMPISGPLTTEPMRLGNFTFVAAGALLGGESGESDSVLACRAVTSESGNTSAFEMILYLAPGFDRLGILLHNYIGRCDSRCRKR